LLPGTNSSTPSIFVRIWYLSRSAASSCLLCRRRRVLDYNWIGERRDRQLVAGRGGDGCRRICRRAFLVTEFELGVCRFDRIQHGIA
jgi:hypothetical protein